MVAINTRATALVSLTDDGLPFSGQGSYSPRVSDDGRFVVFTNHNGAQADIYLRDTVTGRTFLASTSSAGAASNGGSGQASVSNDGRYVVFESSASNLVADDTNNNSDIFLRDTQTGKTVRLSTTETGGNGDSFSGEARISGDGRFVAFTSYATNLIAGDANGVSDIVLKDTLTGELQLISRSTAGEQGNGETFAPEISEDGRFVAFLSTSNNLVAGDTNASPDVFIRDTALGTTSRVSISNGEAQGNGGATSLSMSSNGRYVAFTSNATNLVSGDANGAADVFLRDVVAGTTVRASLGNGGVQANGASTIRDVSADGRYVLFASDASNLVSGDTNADTDLFLRDMVAGITIRLSVGPGGEQAHAAGPAQISADGRYVVFNTNAGNIVADDTNGVQDVFRLSLFASAAADWMVGSDAADTISSLGGSDIINGGRGNDTLNGGAGMDKMSGGAGNDIFYVDNFGDKVVELAGEGTDTVATNVSFALGIFDVVEVLRTTSSTGTSALSLTGNALKQTITGNAGANTLHDGGAGKADTMSGLSGNDLYRVYNSGDVIVETSTRGAADRVMAAVDYALGAGVHIESLTTNGSTGTSDIKLTGNEIAQEIVGNAGDNRLEGKGGSDTLRGLSGDDTFVFASTLGAANVDRILDFNVADDRFLLSDAIFTALNTGVLLSGYFRANTTGLAQDANDHVIYETDTGELYYDSNGSAAGGGVLFARITAGLSLTNADFTVA